MKFRMMAGAIAAAGLLSVAGQAAAAQYVATYTGHVIGGYDETGVFGLGGSYLDGQAFTARFTYDTALGTGTSQQRFGALTDAVLTINGADAHFASFFIFPGESQIESHAASPFGSAGPGYAFHQSSVDVEIPPLPFLPFSASIHDVLTLSGAGAVPNSLGQAVAQTPLVDPFTGGPADYAGFFRISEDFLIGHFAASGDLRTETYSVSQVGGAVPEPAAWALMIVGFGAAGAMLRLRRRAAFA